MTLGCTITLAISLALYFVATLLFQGDVVLHRSGWNRWGRRILIAGMAILAVGLLMHFLMAGPSPFSDMLVIIALLVLALLFVGLLVEHYARLHRLSALLAPLAFFALLYPVLMPIRFDQAESILLRYPWLGVHVFVSMLGLVGFALAFCTASAYLVQAHSLKRGRLNRYLPALDTAASATYLFAGMGFLVFTLGLVMGVIWLFGAPGEHLGGSDLKIWMAVPTWLVFAVYLYLRGVDNRHGSRLKWLIIVGFLLSLANLFGVRHNFGKTPSVSLGAGQGKEAALLLPAADVHALEDLL